jgi:hypothetical protein
MQIFNKNRFLFGFTLSWILGMPPTAIAETHLPDSDEKKPVIIQLERLPEVVPRESDELKSARDRQRESRKKRAKRKNVILLERINSQKMGWAIKRYYALGIEGIKNTIIDPKGNWFIIPSGKEVIVINMSEPHKKETPHLRGLQEPCVHIPADDLDYASEITCVHIPAKDLD